MTVPMDSARNSQDILKEFTVIARVRTPNAGGVLSFPSGLRFREQGRDQVLQHRPRELQLQVLGARLVLTSASRAEQLCVRGGGERSGEAMLVESERGKRPRH